MSLPNQALRRLSDQTPSRGYGRKWRQDGHVPEIQALVPLHAEMVQLREVRLVMIATLQKAMDAMMHVWSRLDLLVQANRAHVPHHAETVPLQVQRGATIAILQLATGAMHHAQ